MGRLFCFSERPTPAQSSVLHASEVSAILQSYAWIAAKSIRNYCVSLSTLVAECPWRVVYCVALRGDFSDFAGNVCPCTGDLWPLVGSDLSVILPRSPLKENVLFYGRVRIPLCATSPIVRFRAKNGAIAITDWDLWLPSAVLNKYIHSVFDLRWRDAHHCFRLSSHIVQSTKPKKQAYITLSPYGIFGSQSAQCCGLYQPYSKWTSWCHKSQQTSRRTSFKKVVLQRFLDLDPSHM